MTTPMDTAREASQFLNLPPWAILKRARTLAKKQGRVIVTPDDVNRVVRRLKRRGKG